MSRCPHDLPIEQCAICTPLTIGGRPVRPAGDVDEPTGHRGHPSPSEVEAASRLRPRILTALQALTAAGVERPLSFLAELARMRARGEDWATLSNAESTIVNVLDGGAAKAWSIELLFAACADAEQLARD